MAQRINIQLGIQADTSQARTQIQQLQKDLSALTQVRIQDGSIIPGLDPKSLGEANAQIARLKTVLNDAFNVKTGKLDLNQFEVGLKRANLNVDTLAKTFQSMGPAGTAAFSDLAKMVASAEAPILRVGEGMRKFMMTFANSARYMVATRALNTFVGSIQNALNYAQDLNKSLNNIAIVTGASTDKMAEFAAQANKAAQRLSVTTTGYTDAALIYYQQGLSDQEVAARTETTMKMSNVTGESAQEVSSYMTAIWNNFYDGSESIETFADKITALGAATASSSQEIANGLQQFAAVANTVGLSYDYAATALATIVAQTRQSESTVGNGLRTLFSRMQGLKLDGETEDGVTLNKYSQALADVGVNALDASGELRDMDDILTDLGSKWETLSKAQQVALAQTVGGVRQYTTLVALMDNFDKFQENLAIAQGAEGTLQQQQEIYERSWEASRKRVQAAAQSIYQDIIDDKFFISLNDLFAEFLKGVDQVIKGLGGVKGILSVLATLATTVFGDQMANKIDRFVVSLKNLYDPTRIQKQQQEWFNAFRENFSGGGTTDFDKITSNYATEALKSQIDLKAQVLKVSQSLTAEERSTVEMLYKQAEAAQNTVIEETKRLQIAKQRNDFDYNATAGLKNMVIKGEDLDWNSLAQSDITVERITRLRDTLAEIGTTREATARALNLAEEATGIEDFIGKINQLKEAIGEDTRLSKEFKEIINSIGEESNLEEIKEKLIWLRNGLTSDSIQEGVSTYSEDQLVRLLFSVDYDTLSETGKKVYQKLMVEMNQHGIQLNSVLASKTVNSAVSNAVEDATKKVNTFGDSVVDFARNASSMAMQINGIRGAITALNDKDIAPWEQFTRVISGFGMLFSPNGVGTQFIQGIGKFRAATAAMDSKSFQAVQAKMFELNAFKNNLPKQPIFNNNNLPQGLRDYGFNDFNFTQKNGNLQSVINANGTINGRWTKDIDNLLNSSEPLSVDDERKINLYEMLEGMDNGQRKDIRSQIQEYQELLKTYNEESPQAAARIEELRESINALGEEHGIKNLADSSASDLEKLGNASISTGKAIWAAFGPMIKMIAIMAAVAAAIWAIKTAWENWYKTTAEGRIETRINEIQKLDENIQNLKTSIEETKRQIEGLDEFDEKLADAQWELDKVTDKNSYEFKNIVSETNLELMQTVKSMGLWEDAIIKINDQGLFEIQNQKELNKLLQEKLSIEESRLWQLEEMKTRRQQEAQFLENSKDDYETLATGLQTISYENKDTPYKVGQTRTRERRVNKFSEEETNKLLDTLQQVATDLKLPDIKSLSNVRDDNAKAIKKALVDDAGFSPQVFDALFKNENADTLWHSLANIEQTIVETGKTPEAEAIQYGKMFAEQNLDKKEYENWSSEDFKSYYDYINQLKKSYSDEDIRNFDYKPTWLSKEYQDTAFYKENASDYAIGEDSFVNMYGGIGSGQYGQATDIKKEYIAYALPDKYELVDSGSLKDIEKNIIVADKEISEIFELENLQTRYNEDVLNAMAGTDDEGYAEWKEKQNPGQNSENEEEIEDNSWSTNTKTQDQEILGYMDKENSEAWELLSQRVEEYAESLKTVYPELKDQDEALKVIAWDSKLAAEGYEELTENGESWIKKIKKGSSGAEKALLSLSQTMQKVVGLSDNFKEMGVNIDAEFGNYLEKHLEEVEAAANGDVEALKELQKQAFLIGEMKLIDSVTPENGLSEEDKKNLKNRIESMYDYIRNEIDTGESLKLGENVEISPTFYSDLDKIVSATAKTKEEAEATLSSLNLNVADFDLIPVPHEETVYNEVDEHPDPADPKKTVPPIKWKTTTRQTSWHAVPKGAAQGWAKENGHTTTDPTTQKGNSRVALGDGLYLKGVTGGVIDGQHTVSQDTINEMIQWGLDHPTEVQVHGLPSGAGLAPPGGLGTGSGGGGGGGGGSGGKEREQKVYEDEIERYHYLLKTIDAVNKKYDELENAREKAYGTDEIEIMDKEIENLQQQIGLQKQYLDAISQDYLSDRAAIAAYGAQFDENGNIINYEEIYRRQIDLVNSAAGDDEAADKAYEQFKKVLEQYEKTNELLQDTKLSYQELLDKAAELNLEKITVSVDYNVAISDRDRKYLEWLADNMGDGIDKTADKIANLSKQMETYAKDAQTYAEGINAIFEEVGVDNALEQIINGELNEEKLRELNLTEQQINQIQEYQDKLMETQSAERDLAESAVEELKTAFSNWNEEISNSIDRITSLNDSLEKYRDIMGLLDEDIVGSTKALNDEIDAAERQNNIRAINGQQQRYEQAQSNLERLKTLYQDAQNQGNKVAAEALKESIEEAEEAVIQAHQDMLEATSEALSALESQWEASMERISKEFAKNLTGMNDISYFQDLYDRQKEMSDWYLDDYEKYYNLNKLITRINKDLSNDDVLAVSGKLNGLLGKINGSLAEGAQISEATVGYYEKELDLIEAQMALEAARNAKSEVRMVRDNEGNMSYVYTADSNAIESAEEQYQEKWYELMNYTTEQQDELQEKMISSMQDFIDRAVEAAEKFGIGTDAFNEELANIQRDFSATFNYLGSEAENAFAMMMNAKNNWWQDLTETLQKPVASESDFITSFGKTILGGLMGIETSEDWIKAMNGATGTVLSQIYNSGQDYLDNQEAVLNAANSSLESFVDDTTTAVGENQVMAQEEMDQLQKTLEDGEPNLEKAIDAMSNFNEQWGSQMTELEKNISPVVSKLNEFYEAISKIENISSSGSNPFNFTDAFTSWDTSSVEETLENATSQLDLGNITNQLIGNPITISDISMTGITAALNSIPSGELDQNVQITANFPNVVNHREIELALNNLVLSASQYANRK